MSALEGWPLTFSVKLSDVRVRAEQGTTSVVPKDEARLNAVERKNNGKITRNNAKNNATITLNNLNVCDLCVVFGGLTAIANFLHFAQLTTQLTRWTGVYTFWGCIGPDSYQGTTSVVPLEIGQLQFRVGPER
jgi:hypothetical protein